jgi:hypothetical protein
VLAVFVAFDVVPDYVEALGEKAFRPSAKAAEEVERSRFHGTTTAPPPPMPPCVPWHAPGPTTQQGAGGVVSV